MNSPTLFWGAQPQILESSEFLVTIGLLVLALLGGGVVIFFLDRWKRRMSQSRPEHVDQLTQYREMYENGELSKDEYESIRSQLSHQIRESLDAPRERPRGDSPKP